MSVALRFRDFLDKGRKDIPKTNKDSNQIVTAANFLLKETEERNARAYTVTPYASNNSNTDFPAIKRSKSDRTWYSNPGGGFLPEKKLVGCAARVPKPFICL